MDPHLVFVKTDKGREEIARRAHGLTQRKRVVLIMVDGASDVATMQNKLLSVTDLPAILEELALHGFIAARSGEWQPSVGRAGSGAPDAPLTLATPAEAKAALIDMAVLVLGDDAARITRKLREAPDTPAGLREATAACRKLVELTIDQAKGAELNAKCAEILAALERANDGARSGADSSMEDTRARLVELTIAVLGKDVEPVTRRLNEAPADAGALRSAVAQCCKLVRLTIDEDKARAIEREAGRLLG